MHISAHAKINLDLHILGKRPDGYHELSTIMQGIALSDDLEIDVIRPGYAEGAPSADEAGFMISLEVDGADLPADKTNLAWRAAEAMLFEAEKRGRSVPRTAVRIRLTKRIPMAAGLGGGSSDAAAVLLALNELLSLSLPFEVLCAIGKKLGADVPFCLYVNAEETAAALCTGIGDFIEPVPAEERFCVLVKPALDISTPEMYRAWDEMQTMATNDFEPIAEYKYPAIREVKNAISEASQINDTESNANGLVQLQMSGSGPTVFALYETEEEAAGVAARLEGRFPTVLLTKTLA